MEHIKQILDIFLSDIFGWFHLLRVKETTYEIQELMGQNSVCL
jgi:hypothetical protein